MVTKPQTSNPQAGPALAMPGSIFDGVQLLPRLLRYPTLDGVFRLNAPLGARFRAIVDAWVAGDAAADRAKTRTDLLKPGTSTGTWHELMLREVLRRKFGVVEREPAGLPVGPKKPDFGVRIGRTQRLVVFESASISEKVDEATRKRRAIIRRLDRISGPWHLVPEWIWSHELEAIQPKVVEAVIRKKIGELPPGEHKLNIPFGDDAVFRATLIPASQHRESIVSMDIPTVGYSFGVEAIRDDIKEKTARYRALQAAGVPFILAIGSGIDPGLIDWESMFSAMYGDEEVTLTFKEGEVVAVAGGRLKGGKITPSSRSEPRHRTLSAAWLIRWRLQSDDELYAELVHFPNPWAANPVRIAGQDISRVTFKWVIPQQQAALLLPRRLRLLKVS